MNETCKLFLTDTTEVHLHFLIINWHLSFGETFTHLFQMRSFKQLVSLIIDPRLSLLPPLLLLTHEIKVFKACY